MPGKSEVFFEKQSWVIETANKTSIFLKISLMTNASQPGEKRGGAEPLVDAKSLHLLQV